MKVRNIDARGAKECSCGSWLEHWRKYSNQALPTLCAEEKCQQKPEVGALVRIDRHGEHEWFVVPLCRRHGEELQHPLNILDHVALVSADVSKTCGTHHEKHWWE